MNLFFSVIIPLFNKERFIEKTLQSVLSQDFEHFEIIIVDDGSTDNSVNLIENFSDSRITLLKQENKGVSAARNKGISLARAKHIALIDADDFWYNNHLSELKRQITLFPNAGLYCNNYEVYLAEDTKRSANFNFNYSTKSLLIEDYFEASIINSVAWSSAVAFTKEKFDAVGGYDEYLDTSEDLDLWIKFALNYKVSFNPSLTMSYKYYINDSLTKKETNSIRMSFINRYRREEKKNESLKLYLDIYRYALAIRCKVLKDYDTYNTAKRQIELSNLNLKQKLLLNSPRFLLVFLKKVQTTLIKNDIYISAFK